MSNFFGSMERLKSQARKNVETGDYILRKWWVDKYKIPTNSPLFQSRSWAEWQIEMFEDMFTRRDELKEKLEDGELDSKVAMPILNSLNKALDGEEFVLDEKVDEWEKELAEGKIPNLEY